VNENRDFILTYWSSDAVASVIIIKMVSVLISGPAPMNKNIEEIHVNSIGMEWSTVSRQELYGGEMEKMTSHKIQASKLGIKLGYRGLG
jgi:hypothetical protein